MPQPVCLGSGTLGCPTATEVYGALHFVVPFLDFGMAISKAVPAGVVVHCAGQIDISRCSGCHSSEKTTVVHAVRMLIHHHPFVGWISNVALLEVNLLILRAIPKFIITLSHIGVHGEGSDSLGPSLLFLCGTNVFVRRAVNQVFTVSLIGCQLGIT